MHDINCPNMYSLPQKSALSCQQELVTNSPVRCQRSCSSETLAVHRDSWVWCTAELCKKGKWNVHYLRVLDLYKKCTEQWTRTWLTRALPPHTLEPAALSSQTCRTQPRSTLCSKNATRFSPQDRNTIPASPRASPVGCPHPSPLPPLCWEPLLYSLPEEATLRDQTINYVNDLVDETSREAESAVEAEVHVDEGPQRQRVPQLQHNIEASRAWERGPNFCSVRAKNMAWAASLYSVMFGT